MRDEKRQSGPERFRHERRQVVQEKVFRMIVNGREFLSLIASPHDPESLVIGFLFLQGLIRDQSDIVSLGICRDSGQVVTTIKAELPEQLRPTLTSGCGGGIVFDDPNATQPERLRFRTRQYSDDNIHAAMAELFQASQKYSLHGGIHSAGLHDGQTMVLSAEDLGRHNSIDRLAGLALMADIDMVGHLLLTSGRISSEMAVKASRLGVAVIASRTSPTDLAVEVCRRSEIGLAGYVRGGAMQVYVDNGCFNPPEGLREDD